jgi:hypothetical protein
MFHFISKCLVLTATCTWIQLSTTISSYQNSLLVVLKCMKKSSLTEQVAHRLVDKLVIDLVQNDIPHNSAIFDMLF